MWVWMSVGYRFTADAGGAINQTKDEISNQDFLYRYCLSRNTHHTLFPGHRRMRLRTPPRMARSLLWCQCCYGLRSRNINAAPSSHPHYTTGPFPDALLLPSLLPPPKPCTTRTKDNPPAELRAFLSQDYNDTFAK